MARTLQNIAWWLSGAATAYVMTGALLAWATAPLAAERPAAARARYVAILLTEWPAYVRRVTPISKACPHD